MQAVFTVQPAIAPIYVSIFEDFPLVFHRRLAVTCIVTN